MLNCNSELLDNFIWHEHKRTQEEQLKEAYQKRWAELRPISEGGKKQRSMKAYKQRRSVKQLKCWEAKQCLEGLCVLPKKQSLCMKQDNNQWSHETYDIGGILYHMWEESNDSD